MMTTPIPSNAAIVAALDPTYTLKPGPWRLTHEHLGAYLRFHYLLVGPLIVPRTYFIHGRHNPFVDLHESGKQGRREICDLLTSGAAYVTGHDHPAFQTLADHLRTTAAERHPMVFDSAVREPIAREFNSFLRDAQVVNIPVADATRGFRRAFEKELRTVPGIAPKDWTLIDEYAINRLVWRNRYNAVKCAEWGRNEVCDYIKQFAGARLGRILADCAVAAYQRTFAPLLRIEWVLMS